MVRMQDYKTYCVMVRMQDYKTYCVMVRMQDYKTFCVMVRMQDYKTYCVMVRMQDYKTKNTEKKGKLGSWWQSDSFVRKITLRMQSYENIISCIFKTFHVQFHLYHPENKNIHQDSSNLCSTLQPAQIFHNSAWDETQKVLPSCFHDFPKYQIEVVHSLVFFALYYYYTESLSL